MREDTLFEVEKAAMLGDRTAVIELISRFRELKMEVDRCRASAYGDGECDAATLCSLWNKRDEVESPGEE